LAIITERNIDVSNQFLGDTGTIIMTHTIKSGDLPRAALIVDHGAKEMYVYSYKETADDIILDPIDDDEVRAQLEEIVQNEILPREKQD